MNTTELVAQARALQERIKRFGSRSQGALGEAAKAQVCEFLRSYAGPKSAFLKEAQDAKGHSEYMVATLGAILDSYVDYLNAGLATGLSPERKAQLDVVSDILGQAQSLLDDDGIHPATAVMLIGASLEEFLRTWVEGENLSIGNARRGIDAYAKSLRAAELITKQDDKDITSWAGLRNHAAHGQWDEVSDRARVRLMLDGINLFIRQKQEAR